MATETEQIFVKANNRLFHRNQYTEKILYRLMLAIDLIDVHEVPIDIKNTVEYKDASHILGWDVDWEALAKQ